VIYERAKGIHGEKAFGTERDVNEIGYEYLVHSTKTLDPPDDVPRVTVGGPDCNQPYSMALLNVSAMSFGALSSNALLALNTGAAKGGFAHDTGEGGLTDYHLRNGGDLIWEVGSGYFGCRTQDGDFDAAMFADKAAHPNVKCVSLKLSQGAKPGIGGVLPAAKVTREIAEARSVPQGEKCISPPYHRVFSTPRELVLFVARMRELAGGKPTGIKLCVGTRRDVLAICKAMREEDVTPDFIVVDGSEGGTGAAPLEYEDHVGTPLTEGLMCVHNSLIGTGLRDRVKIGAQRQGRQRQRHRQAHHPGRRLHQRRPGDDDGRRLHPGTALPHQHLPRRSHHAGPETCPGPRCRRQVVARTALPGRHRPAGEPADRLDGTPEPRSADAAVAATTHRPHDHEDVRRAVRLARAERAPARSPELLGRRLGGGRSGPLLSGSTAGRLGTDPVRRHTHRTKENS
jgi:hypothetical protein